MTSTAAPPAPSRFAFALVTSLFFAWGFLTALNDVLVPHLRRVFALSYAQGALVQFTFFAAYFVAALPAGAAVARVGFRRGIVLGLATSAVGAGLFLPAAAYVSFPLFLGALFVLAVGVTLIQVAANPYVAMLGDPARATRRLNLAQGFNSLGTTLAPAFGGWLILGARPSTPLQDARAVELPYLAIALALGLLAVGVGFLHLPQVASGTGRERGVGVAAALRHRNLVLGAVAIFLYVGAEVSVGSFAISFLAEPSIRGLAPATAARWVSLYWGGAMVGRFLGAALLGRMSPGRMLSAAALGAIGLLLTSGLASGDAAVAALLALGLCNSIMFPTLFALALEGLGDAAPAGSSLLVMSVVGGAILPVAEGALADRVGLHHAFLPLVLAYAFILAFGLRQKSPARPIATGG